VAGVAGGLGVRGGLAGPGVRGGLAGPAPPGCPRRAGGAGGPGVRGGLAGPAGLVPRVRGFLARFDPVKAPFTGLNSARKAESVCKPL
jgi:hypothetical protein